MGDGCEAVAKLEWALARGVGGMNSAESAVMEEDLVWGKKVLNTAREKTCQLQEIILLVSYIIAST